MPDQPNPRELLGGYATSTLSRQEREELFAAALEDQQLFDELVDEESLRELLDDPLERQRLINELSEERRVSDRWFPVAALRKGSLYSRYLALSGVVIAVAVIGAWLARSAGRPAIQPATQASRQESARVNPPPAAPAGPAIDQVQKEAVQPTDASVEQSARLARQADRLRKLAREQFARGERDQALSTATNVMRMQPNDSELKGILDDALSEARARLRVAHENATAVADRQSTSYRDAVQREQDLLNFAKSGRRLEAIRSAWLATELFTKAAEDAGKSSSPTSPTSPTSPAGPANGNSSAAPQPFAPPVAAPSQNPGADETAIRALLRAYAVAYSRLDVQTIKRLFPAINAQQLAQAFASINSMETQIRDETFVSLTGTTATVSCTWDGLAVSRLGTSQRTLSPTVFRLQKSPSAEFGWPSPAGGWWIIVERR